MDKFKVALQQMKAVRTPHVRLVVISMPKSVSYKRVEDVAEFKVKDLFGSRMRPRAHVVNFFKSYLAEPHYAFEVEAVAESEFGGA